VAAKNIAAFKGKVQKISPKLLEDSYAQTATNCSLESGQIVPLKDLSQVTQVSNFRVVLDASDNPFSSATSYNIGDIVYFSTTSRNYICIKTNASTSVAPNAATGSQYWTEITIDAIDDSGTTWVSEISDIVCDAASHLTASGAGDYIKLYTPDLNIYIWFDVDSGNVDPKGTDTALQDFYGIEVDVASGDAADVVAGKVSTVLAAYTSTSEWTGLFSAKAVATTNAADDTVRLTNKYAGSVTDISIGTISGGNWDATPNTQGVDGNYIVIGSAVETIYLLDDRWLIFGSDVNVVKSTTPDSNYLIYYTGDSFPKQTDYDDATGGDSPTDSETWPTTKYRLGVEKPPQVLTAATEAASPGGSGIDSDIVTAYVYTYVTDKGEEGPPSDPSDTLTVNAVDDYQVQLTGFQYPTHDLNNIVSVRIYRVNAGDTLGDYQLVNSTDLPTTTAVTAGYEDSVNPSDLGEAISTENFDAPPDTLTNIVMYGNGLYAGFKNNDIYFSEPFYPYAWPDEYRVNIAENTAIGLGVMGGGLVALTDGHPRIIQGSHPNNMVETPLPYNKPCKSKTGIVSSKHGITYPSDEGLYHIAPNTGVNLTDKIYSRAQWQALGTLTDIFGVFHDNKYYGFFKNTGTGFIFDFDNPDYIVDISHPTLTFKGGYSTGTDFYLLSTLANVEYIYKWGESSDNLTYTWKSKKFQEAAYKNLSTARVLGSGTVTLNLYVDGVLKHTETSLTTNRFFRLPSGFRGYEFEIEVTGTATIDLIQAGSSIVELGE
jgi:hypothetical protein